MAHLILENDTMFSVKETPWHKLGVVLNEPPTIEEAIRLAGLGWTVKTVPLFTAENTKVEALATVNESTNEILGVVGPNYVPLQNTEAFEFFQPFLDTNEASLECAGSLNNNRRVWILAKINRDPSVIVKQSDDIVNKYILLSNSHDGTLAVRVGFTPIRVVCNNTLTLAHNSQASKLIRIKHTRNVVSTLEKIQEIINVANQEFEATAEQYRFLASRECNRDDLEKFVKRVFMTKQQMDLIVNGQEIDTGKRVMSSIQNLFENGTGNDLTGVRGTYWAAYNAVTEFIQYERGSKEETRLNETWFGTGQTLNKKALETAILMAA